jgi:polar amino acid transport system substrate-binding protein
MKLINKSVVTAVASCAFLAASLAHADQLADIKTKDTLVCGVLDIFEPFGYTDMATRKISGYDVDVCNGIGKRLGVKVDIKPVADAARIPELQQGHMDILAAGLAYTPQRAAQIDYSDSYYTSNNILAVKVSRGYSKAEDLSGKRVSFVKGTISEPFIRENLPTAKPVGYDDISTAFTVLVQGKVEAFSTSEEATQKLISRLGADASKYAVLNPPIGNEFWSIGVKKGEPALLDSVNQALRDMESSGEMQTIFDKWLGEGTLYKMKRSFTVQPVNSKNS